MSLMNSAKELFSQKKSVLVVKSTTFTHSLEVNTLDFFVETVQTFSVNISIDVIFDNPLDYLKCIIITCFNRWNFFFNKFSPCVFEIFLLKNGKSVTIIMETHLQE